VNEFCAPRSPRAETVRAQAAALGAGFYAAGLSPSFRVRKISVEDIFPFGVSARPCLIPPYMTITLLKGFACSFVTASALAN
jgi:hypothetical protein